MTTRKERWAAALIGIEKSGVVLRVNVAGCCRGCILAEPPRLGLVDDDDQRPYAWTFGGQGGAYSWRDDQTLSSRNEVTAFRSGRRHREPRPLDEVWFYHGNGAAPVVVQALRDQGFVVTWNGSDDTAVRVQPNEDMEGWPGGAVA